MHRSGVNQGKSASQRPTSEPLSHAANQEGTREREGNGKARDSVTFTWNDTWCWRRPISFVRSRTTRRCTKYRLALTAHWIGCRSQFSVTLTRSNHNSRAVQIRRDLLGMRPDIKGLWRIQRWEERYAWSSPSLEFRIISASRLFPVHRVPQKVNHYQIIKKIFLFPYFLFFSAIFNHDFIIYIDFTHVETPNAATGDVTN